MTTLEANSRTTQEARNCERHGEYMATVKKYSWGCNGETYKTLCPTCEGEREQRRKQQEVEYEERKRRERIAINRKAAEIPERFAGCSFENYEATTAKQKQVLSSARGFAENFEVVRESGSSLALCGKPGCGKTHLACAVGNHVLEGAVQSSTPPRSNSCALFVAHGVATRSKAKTLSSRGIEARIC